VVTWLNARSGREGSVLRSCTSSRPSAGEEKIVTSTGEIAILENHQKSDVGARQSFRTPLGPAEFRGPASTDAAIRLKNRLSALWA
jgi:hypothetical protein